MRLPSFGNHSKRNRPKWGSALLETTLALALLAPLAVMAGQYAWGYYQIQSLHSVVEETARFAASASMRDGEDAWKASVRQFALCGSPEPCSDPRIALLRPENVQVELLRPERSATMARVSIEGFSLTIPGATKRFDGTPSAQFPRIEATP